MIQSELTRSPYFFVSFFLFLDASSKIFEQNLIILRPRMYQADVDNLCTKGPRYHVCERMAYGGGSAEKYASSSVTAFTSRIFVGCLVVLAVPARQHVGIMLNSLFQWVAEGGVER